MVNVGTVKEGSVGYYTQSDELTAEEYYSVKGTEVGTWLGRGASAIGLSGKVEKSDFEAIMHGRKPGEETLLAPSFAMRTVLGIDTVFRAPKSVSLMFALGDESIAKEIIKAHRAAALRGLEYLEDRAIGGREGKGGARKVSGDGTIASSWTHVTSRAGDPLLHTHIVHANLIHSENGKWVALDSNKIFAHAKTAGHIYQAELRKLLSERLGVQWTAIKNGCADVEGIDPAVVRHFSKRRAEIMEAVEGLISDDEASTASRSPKAMQAATLETRRSKGSEPEARAFERWRDEADSLGFGVSDVRAACGGATLLDNEIDYLQVAQEVAGSGGVTSKRAAFSRHLVVDEIANRLPPSVGADVVEATADKWIEEYAIPLEPEELAELGNYRVSRSGERAMTTLRMYELEHTVLVSAVGRRGEGTAQVAPHILARKIGPGGTISLNDGQQAMIRKIHSSGNGVDLVVGDAGTGKTTALGVSRKIFESQRFKVVGAAISHAAKEQLQDGAGIESRTVASLVRAIERNDFADAFPGGQRTALVIDEAAMVGTEQIKLILESAAQVGAKVVLVGDHKQLPSIDAGGWFEVLADQLDAPRLTENLRQNSPVEKSVVDAMAAGAPDRAYDIVERSGMLTIKKDVFRATRALIDACESDGAAGQSLVVTGTNEEADIVNRFFQARNRSQVQGKPVAASSRAEFDVGEPVIFRANQYELGVHNRERGVVEVVNPETGDLSVRMTRSGELVHVPRAVAADPAKFSLSYANTIHVAQGATVDNCYVLAASGLSQEQFYVALSRAQKKTRVFATEEWVENEAGFGASVDANQRIKSGLSRSQSEGSAMGYGKPAGGAGASRRIEPPAIPRRGLSL